MFGSAAGSMKLREKRDVAIGILMQGNWVQKTLGENAGRQGIGRRIAEMMEFLNEQAADLQEYAEQMVRRLIEKITVFDDKLTVEFKSCVEIDIEL